MLNHIVIMGRLARNPELRHTRSGTAAASFTLAVDRDFKDKTTGERATDWIDVVAWRGTGEFVGRYFFKGRMAVVDGQLQIREWTDREGNKRRSAEVVAEHVYFGDSRQENTDRERLGRNIPGYPSEAADRYFGDGVDSDFAKDQFAELADDDGDLPF